MQTVLTLLNQRFHDAFKKVLPPEYHAHDPLIRATEDAKFGDYQANAAMGLAKELKKKPRDIAQDIAAALDVKDVCSRVELAGPGFINMTLSPEFIQNFLEPLKNDSRVGIQPA